MLLPDGLRFSPATTRRDWTDESTSRLRDFFARHVGGDGRLQVQPWLDAAARHRSALIGGTATPADVSARENLNAKYFAMLWSMLNEPVAANQPAGTNPRDATPLNAIRARWRSSVPADAAAVGREIAALQAGLWKTDRVGSYVRREADGYAENRTRQVPVDPPAVSSFPLRVSIKPVPGQTDVVLHLTTREIIAAGGGRVVWSRPRFEANGQPTFLLRDYAAFGLAFEVDDPSILAGSEEYLAVVVVAANDREQTLDEPAKKHSLDVSLLKRWAEVLAVEPIRTDDVAATIPAVPLVLLDEVTAPNPKPAIQGWRKRGTDLPVLVTNSSDAEDRIPAASPCIRCRRSLWR